jgi:hypothetical protein
MPINHRELARRIDALIKASLHPTTEPWMKAFIAQARLESALGELGLAAKPQSIPTAPVTPTTSETAITIYNAVPTIAEIPSETPREKICRLLGLDVGSDEKLIAKTYRKKAREIHPDKTKGLPKVEQEHREGILIELNKAWEDWEQYLQYQGAFNVTPADFRALFTPSTTEAEESEEARFIRKLRAEKMPESSIEASLQSLFCQLQANQLTQKDKGLVLLDLIVETMTEDSIGLLEKFITFLQIKVISGFLDPDDYIQFMESAIAVSLKNKSLNPNEGSLAKTTLYLQECREREERIIGRLNIQLTNPTPSEEALQPILEDWLTWRKGWSTELTETFQHIVGSGSYPQATLQLMAHLREARKQGKVTPKEYLEILQNAFNQIANRGDEKYKKIQFALGAEILYLETVAQVREMETELETTVNTYQNSGSTSPVVIEAAIKFNTRITSANRTLSQHNEPSTLSNALKRYKNDCESAVRELDSKVAHFRGDSLLQTIASWIRRLFACVSKSCRKEYEVDQQASVFRDTIKTAYTSQFRRHQQFFQEHHEEENKSESAAPGTRPSL